MSKQDPVPYFRLDREDFPITLEAFHPKTRKIVWTLVVRLPETRIEIPPLAKLLGHPISMRIKFATGRITETDPSGKTIEVIQ